MKKFTSLMVAALALPIASFAEVPEPVDLTDLLANPSFETEGAIFDGWTPGGGLFAGGVEQSGWRQDQPGNWPAIWSSHNTQGTYVARWNTEATSVNDKTENVTIDPAKQGLSISQEVESSKSGGTYVLSACVMWSRDSNRGHSQMDKGMWYSYVFIVDENYEGDPTAACPENGGKIGNNGWGAEVWRSGADATDATYAASAPTYVDDANQLQQGGLGKYYSILTTDSEFLTIGWAVPYNDPAWDNHTPQWGFTKPNIMLDNFQLQWFDTDDTEAVKEYITALSEKESAVGAIEAAPVADGKIFNLQGIEVKEANAPGIYIQNGKKFIVK